MNGIWFDNIHSYTDLNLILSGVNIPPAAVKTTYVDIPGGDGSLDLTEALGAVRYKNRECTFTFTVFPYEDFEEKKTQISNILNGVRCKIKLDKDSDYYWDGRCTINNYESDKNLNKIVISASVAPYKMKVDQTVIIISSGENITGNLKNGRKTVVPTITTASGADVVFAGNKYTLDAGTHTIANIQLKYGDNVVTVSSNDSVTFSYQEGDL